MGEGSSVAVGCAVRRRRGLDSCIAVAGCRLRAAALIRPLAWELSYVTGAALKRKKAKAKKKKIKIGHVQPKHWRNSLTCILEQGFSNFHVSTNH